ncbi:hypothetical protein E3N88_35406 [Mikania micrantha]|uniref:Uncharacterized protein n=1 Tax=Mikania micrantha TaxID=192012 RepID=A0A5N6M1S1_9ASTR|nr:hypothetical protein E3N88_35406 [Mikania micrantha]
MHHLRDVLRKEGILYALDNHITPEPPIGCTTFERMKHIGHECEIKYLILTSVSLEFVDQLMYLSSHEMLEEIKKSFLPNRFWRFEILKEVQKGLRPGGDVRAHVDRLQGYFDRLGKLGYPMNLEVHLGGPWLIEGSATGLRFGWGFLHGRFGAERVELAEGSARVFLEGSGTSRFVSMEWQMGSLMVVRQSEDRLYFYVEDVESFVWTPRTSDFTKKRVRYGGLKVDYSRERGSGMRL